MLMLPTRRLGIPARRQLSIQHGTRAVRHAQDTCVQGCLLAKNLTRTDLTWTRTAISDNFWLIGEDKALNPNKYFIIIPALFGNGQSSSPSNQAAPGPFPRCSFYDNVRAQYKLVTEQFKISHLRAVIGWSMGAAQTFQWATQYPDFMDLAVPFCGSAKTSLHNQVFLEGVKSALLAAKKIPSAGSGEDGIMPMGETFRTWTPEEKDVGLKAFGRGYAGWCAARRSAVFHAIFR